MANQSQLASDQIVTTMQKQRYSQQRRIVAPIVQNIASVVLSNGEENQMVLVYESRKVPRVRDQDDPVSIWSVMVAG